MTTRKDMADQLPMKGNAPARTFVLEVHADSPDDYLQELAPDGWHIQPTEDAYLQVLRSDLGTFWVDRLDDRFWSFHTDIAVGKSEDFLRDLVNVRHDLDWIWLPSGHVRNIWPGAQTRKVRAAFFGEKFLDSEEPARSFSAQLSGSRVGALLDKISSFDDYRSSVSFEGTQMSIDDEHFGRLYEDVNRWGRFVAHGASFALHQQVVHAVVQRYSSLVTAIERKAFGFTVFDEGGGVFNGEPIVINFDREISDLHHFASVLFNSAEPFRLWAVPDIRDGLVRAEVVDLHVGDRLHVDISKSWLRVQLYNGGCGNSVARLITNLQHRYDGALSMHDARLQSHIESGEPVATPG